MALVSVGNEVDAERIRLEFSGQLIDNSGFDDGFSDNSIPLDGTTPLVISCI